MGGDEHALWLTANEGPECTPPRTTWASVSMQGCGWTSPWCKEDCSKFKDGRNQMAQGAKSSVHLDEHGQHAQKCLVGGDRAKLHDVGCHIIHKACCAAGLKSQREVIVPTLATEVLTAPRVDVDQGRRTFDLTSLFSRRKLFTLLQRYEKDKKRHRLRRMRSEQKRTSMGKRREELESLVPPCSSTDDSARGWPCSFASSRGTNEQSAKQPAEMEDDHCKSGKHF